MPKIKERHRHAYELRANGKTFKQIATEMGVSIERVRDMVGQHERNLQYQPGIEQFLQSSGEEALNLSIYHLPLSTRSFNALRNADVRTVRDLIQRTEQELIKSKNFGHKSLL